MLLFLAEQAEKIKRSKYPDKFPKKNNVKFENYDQNSYRSQLLWRIRFPNPGIN